MKVLKSIISLSAEFAEIAVKKYFRRLVKMKKFVCKVCGYEYEGETAPEVCPLCGVGPEDFEEVEE